MDTNMDMNLNLNQLILDEFQKYLEQIEVELLYSKMEGDQKEIKTNENRLKNFKRVIDIIKELDFEIKNANDIKGIPGVGKSSIDKIKQILETGTITISKYSPEKQKIINQIKELTKIIGVGPSTAKKLVLTHKITSVDQLKKAIADGKFKANDKLKLGLKYYGVVQDKIPRAEVEKIEVYLKEEAEDLDNQLELTICGSYRRGKATSNDIDVLITHPDYKFKKHVSNYKKYGLKPMLELFVKKLTETGFILDAISGETTDTKFMGFCRYDEDYPVRRIDIRFVPYISLPTALLYFTGPVELNRDMRTAAIKRGMMINEYGLYKVDEDTDELTRIPVKSEEAVFKKLGMKYLTPIEREKYSMGSKGKKF